jgi:hypothetical protein
MRGAVVLLRKDRVREALQYYCGKIEYVVRRDIRYKLYIYRGRAGPGRHTQTKLGWVRVEIELDLDLVCEGGKMIANGSPSLATKMAPSKFSHRLK